MSTIKRLIHILVLLLLASCVTADKTDYIKLGNEYAKDGLYREAAGVYKKAVVKNPDDVHARRNLGVVLVKLGLYDKAIFQLEKAVKVLTKNYQTQYYLAEAYRATNAYDKAIFHYKSALNIRPGDKPSVTALAWSYYKIKYYQAALKTINKIKRLDRSDASPGIIKARILLGQKRISAAKKLVSTLQKNSNPSFAPYFNSILGDIYFSQGDIAKAKVIYKEALKDRPYLAGALLGIGKIYNIEGDKKKASILLGRAVKLRPSLTEAYFELAKSLEVSNPRRSIALYREFNKRSKNDPEFSNLIPTSKKKIIALVRGIKNERNAQKPIARKPRPVRKLR